MRHVIVDMNMNKVMNMNRILRKGIEASSMCSKEENELCGTLSSVLARA